MTEIDAQLGLPLHRQVTAILMNQIANGEFAVGDRLPTEEALCGQFGVSRVTVRLALKELENAGLLARSPGRGTFLKSAPARRRDDLIRELVDLRHLATHWSRRTGTILRKGTARPPLRASRELRLDPEAEAPYFITDISDASIRCAIKRFYHPEVADAVDDAVRTAPDFDAELSARLGRTVAAARGWAEALLAEPHMIITLRLPLGSPLLSVWTVSEMDGTPVVAAQMLVPGNAVGASFDLDGAS